MRVPVLEANEEIVLQSLCQKLFLIRNVKNHWHRVASSYFGGNAPYRSRSRSHAERVFNVRVDAGVRCY